MAEVTIHGEGLVASAAALLLQDRGISRGFATGSNQRRPVLECNADTIELIRLLLGKERVQNLKGGLLRSRLVRWTGSNFTRIDVNSCVLTYRDLIGQFVGHLADCDPPEGTSEPTWLIHSNIGGQGTRDAPPLDEGGLAFAYGDTLVTAALAPHVSVLEAVSSGWIYMLPLARGHVQLQFCLGEQRSPPFDGDDLQMMLGETTEIRHFVPRVPETMYWTVRRTAVRENAFAQAGELALGDACATLSPISGDITGFGLRSALLAATSIDQVRLGRDVGTVIDHYEQRMVRALSVQFSGYATFVRQAGFASCWGRELDRVDRILADLHQRTDARQPSRLTLKSKTGPIGRAAAELR